MTKLNSNLILSLLNNDYDKDSLTIDEIDCDSFDLEYHLRSFKTAIRLYKKELIIKIAKTLQQEMQPYFSDACSTKKVTILFYEPRRNLFTRPMPMGRNPFILIPKTRKKKELKRSRDDAANQAIDSTQPPEETNDEVTSHINKLSKSI